MKPDWDKLMGKYQGNDKILVGDVDCTAAGKPLCDSNGVKGFPTIKYGEPDSLEAYEGGRDYSALDKFASTLKPSCSPSNIDLCDEEGKAKIEKIQALSADELSAKIKEGDDAIQAAETTFSTELEALQATYQQLMKTKDDTIAAIKESGLGLLKSVQAANKKKKAAAKDEL